MGHEHDIVWVPNTDVIEHADGLLVRMEIAGVDPHTIEIIAAQSALVVSGNRPNPHTGATAQGYRFRQMEIEYGRFERVIPLPYPVKQESIRASCTNGLLEIHLAKAPSGQRRKTVIRIQW